MKKINLVLLAMLSMLMMSSVLVAITHAGQIRMFDISPNPMEEFTTITLGFTTEVNASVYIEDHTGNVIRTLHSGYIDKGLVISWDRLDLAGNYAPNGKYSVVVDYNGRYTSTKKTLILK